MALCIWLVIGAWSRRFLGRRRHAGHQPVVVYDPLVRLLSVTGSAVLIIEFSPTGKDVERQDLADSSGGNSVNSPPCGDVFGDNQMIV